MKGEARFRAQFAAQQFAEPAIDLHRQHAGAGVEQRAGQGAAAGSELEDIGAQG